MQHGVASDRIASHKPATNVESALEHCVAKKTIATTLGVSVRCLERLISSGKFPQPDVVFCRLPRWKTSTVRAWIERGGS